VTRIHHHTLNTLLLLAALALSIPPARSLIEQSMFWHMMVQMPLLILAGYRLTTTLPKHCERFNAYGLTSFMGVLVILTYWMLPVTIDRAVTMPSVDLMKVTSLLLCGICLKTSLDAAPRTAQLFFIGYLLAMLVTLGVYFVTSEVRLCNAYSSETQIQTGYGLIFLAAILVNPALKKWGIRLPAQYVSSYNQTLL
jgi:hypothetical protein